MLGNDIVDLQQAGRDSRWQRKGYLEKICTEVEQELILTAASPSAMLWLLWSMKEAAYKAENRLMNQRFYAPKSFSCTDLSINCTFGNCAQHITYKQHGKFPVCIIPNHKCGAMNYSYARVNYQDRSFYISAVATDQYIHSIAVLDPSDLQHVHLYQQQNQPGYVQDFKLLHPGYSLEKDKAGLPAIINHQTGLKHPASVSHHGQYLAVIYSGSLLLKD